MPVNSSSKPRRQAVLISGASIAGSATAYWLDRYGFDVTVVEQADAVPGGGYPTDLRGSAVHVVDCMGLLPQLRAAHADIRQLRFVAVDKSPIATLLPKPLSDGVADHDVALPRGVLTSTLYDLALGQGVQYRFGDSVDTLEQDGLGVDVHFASGAQQRFDIVIGADGMHSNARALVFGPEASFNRYLSFCFNLFSLPQSAGLAHETVVCAEPGRVAGVYAAGDGHRLQAFLSFAADVPPFRSHADVDKQRQRTAEVFSDGGWIFRGLGEAMQRADDLYFDTVSQIHMPTWSSGRVVLVGDAAYAPSFVSGQGASLALVGAYLLAGELAAHSDPADAFASYEQAARPFMEANQALAVKGARLLMPRTQEELDARNTALATMQASGETSPHGKQSNEVYSSLKLPDYAALIRN